MPADRVDDLEWWRAVELFDHWQVEPPMRDLVEVLARWAGWKPPARLEAQDSLSNEEAIRAVMQQFPDGRVTA